VIIKKVRPLWNAGFLGKSKRPGRHFKCEHEGMIFEKGLLFFEGT